MPSRNYEMIFMVMLIFARGNGGLSDPYKDPLSKFRFLMLLNFVFDLAFQRFLIEDH